MRPDDPVPEGDKLSPLPGEPGIPKVAAPQPVAMSRKGLLAVALLVVSLIMVSAFSIQRTATNGKQADDSKQLRDKPTAASAEPRKLEIPEQPSAPRIPALKPTAEELAEPIGVQRTGRTAQADLKQSAPEDAPVMLLTSRPSSGGRGLPAAAPPKESALPHEATSVTDPMTATSRNLQAYQRQLQGLLDNLTQAADASSGRVTAPTTLAANPQAAPMAGAGPVSTFTPAGSLFGGQLQGSATPKVAASMLGNRSLTLPKGAAFTCALKTQVISAMSGLVGCQVQRNVFSEDGRVLLIERGSHLDGEYRITSVRPGTVRIPVLWTRIRTPLGVTVDIESPGTGPLGESGIDGHIDKRWGERIGAAMLLSLIDDSVKLIIQNQSRDSQADTLVLPSTTANTSKLAEKVLDSTINIPPLIYQHQGGLVGIYVARDVDFSSVYELKPLDRELRP
ncbi:MAG: type IV secretion system protein VirB10 [Methylibium sp.]|nr:type IV secretion system protein VirB10 [Methylibium sp.]